MPATLAQDGTYDALLGGLWSDSARPLVLDDRFPVVAAWRYTGLTQVDVGSGGSVNVVRYSAASFAVAVSAFASSNVPCTLELYARLGYVGASAAWSSSNFPPSRVQGTAFPTRQLEGDLAQGLAVLVASRRFVTAPSGTVTFTLDAGALASLPNHPQGWDGAVNLFMVGRFPSGAAGVAWQDVNNDANGASLTVTEDTADVTGLSTPRMDALGRARRCPRCARLMLSDDFVRDGELRFFVCTWCYDERQVPRHVGRRERPPVNEG